MSFEQGTDLLGPDGVLPWSLHLLRLTVGKGHAPLEALAVAEGYVRPDQFADVRGHAAKLRRGPVLTFLEQPFAITIGSMLSINILTPTRHIYQQESHSQPMPANFKKVHFEHATEYTNDTTFFVRVLKILEPIEQGTEEALSDFVPVEGALLKYGLRGRFGHMELHSPILRLLPSITNTTYMPPTESNHQIERSRVTQVFRKLSFNTLDPRRLSASDFFDLSNTACPRIVTRMLDSGWSKLMYASSDLRLHFPPSTKGFLYLHYNLSFPPLAASIRFRLVPSGDPAQFETGQDLFGPNRKVWKLTAPRLAWPKRFESIRACLQDEGPPEIAQALTAAAHLSVTKPCSILTYLEQPFVVDSYFYTKKSRHATRGRLILRFERSQLPQHAMGNFVVLRVLKILEPVEFSGIQPDAPLPRPGELLKHYNQLYNIRTWTRAFDLNSPPKTYGPHTHLKHLPSVPHLQPNLDDFR
ncbi:hypothetical protein DXG01_016916 [Tephrocybe rancida]|nr:hypothetical protein DXG01_016916 [Tephrocybe rancida]